MNFFVGKLFAIVVLMIWGSGCSDGKSVATFGTDKITLNEFRAAYTDVLRQTEEVDSDSLREWFLDGMIDKRLLASEALKSSVTFDESFQLQLSAYRDHCLREEYFRSVIQPKIKISDTSLDEIGVYLRQERRFRRLYFRDKASAKQAFRLIENGASFIVLENAVPYNINQPKFDGDLGWLSWEEMEFDAAMVGFRQKPGIVTRPIHTGFAWSILQITGVRNRNSSSVSSEIANRKFIRRVIERSIGEQFSFDYARSMPLKSMPRIESRTLNWVSERIAFGLARVPALGDLTRDMQLSDAELAQLEKTVQPRRNDVLAEINGQEMTVVQFVHALRYVPYSVTSKSVVLAMDYVIRDVLLTQKAKEIGLEKKSGSIPIKLQLFEENYIQGQYRIRLIADNARTIGNSTEEGEKVVRDAIDRLRKSVEIRKNSTLTNPFK
ncbi:MAG: hypothetical protein WC703_06615 [Candidatus Neomarinimicrobiota bacterium]